MSDGYAPPLLSVTDRALLHRACHLVNKVMRRYTGSVDTCIASAASLRDVLVRLGYEAEVLRVEAAVFPLCDDPRSPRSYGAILGGDGDGTRRAAASPGNWHGHLVTIVGRRILLDPTLDQVNQRHRYLGATPMVVEVTPEFLAGEKSITVETGSKGATVRFKAFPGRGGYRFCQQYRPRWRQPVVNAVVRRLNSNHAMAGNGAASSA